MKEWLQVLKAADAGAATLIVGNRMANPNGMPWLRRQVNRWMSRQLSRRAGRELPDAGWQIRNRIRTIEQISKLMKLTAQEERGVRGAGDKLTMSIPPYFASLIDTHDPACPIRLQSVPLDYEFGTRRGFEGAAEYRHLAGARRVARAGNVAAHQQRQASPA